MISAAAPADRAAELRRLHTAPELLVLVNVWDVASARVVAALPGCRAVTTASHSIAASFGYPDGGWRPARHVSHTDGRPGARSGAPARAV
jgi:2-methylisocitrate lyase-like PEP mutase family enzyme